MANWCESRVGRDRGCGWKINQFLAHLEWWKFPGRSDCQAQAIALEEGRGGNRGGREGGNGEKWKQKAWSIEIEEGRGCKWRREGGKVKGMAMKEGGGGSQSPLFKIAMITPHHFLLFFCMLCVMHYFGHKKSGFILANHFSFLCLSFSFKRNAALPLSHHTILILLQTFPFFLWWWHPFINGEWWMQCLKCIFWWLIIKILDHESSFVS